MLVPVLVAAFLTSPTLAYAGDQRGYDGDHDHDFARDLYEHGEIRGLHDILRALRQQVSGDIIAVELLQVAGAWVYRFQVVAPDGRRYTIDVAAGPPNPTGRSTDN